MELRFLPNTLTAASLVAQNNNCHPPLTTNAVPVMSSQQILSHHQQQHNNNPKKIPQQKLIQSQSQQQHSIHNDVTLPPIYPHRRTLERSLRNLQNNNHMMNGLGTGAGTGGAGVGVGIGSGSGPGIGNGGAGGLGGGGGGGGCAAIAADEKMTSDGDCGVVVANGILRNSSSMRRTRRGSGSVPGSPRVNRGPSSEYLQHHNRSPMPIRAGIKRATRLGRAENISSGSLNSIEV